MNNQPVNKIKIHPNGKMNPHRKSFRKIVRKFNKTQFNEVVGELCVIMSEFYADSDSEGFADLSASDSETLNASAYIFGLVCAASPNKIRCS